MKFSGRTATAIIEFPRNMLLLVKRNTIPIKGYWALPGGRSEPGETVEQTIVLEEKKKPVLMSQLQQRLANIMDQEFKTE